MQGVAEQAPPEPRPDLRIVGVDVSPDPLRDGIGATLTVMIHNDSSLPAAGSIMVEVVHDRPTPQPLPIRRQILYLGPDELAELTFEIGPVEIERTPYTFFAAVDASRVIEENREADNMFWQRADVCGAAELPEEPDGYDNDCNGLVDDGLGLPMDTAAAVRMLRQMQRQADLDRVPFVYALPKVFGPLVAARPVRVARGPDAWLGNVAGTTPSLRAASEEDSPSARFTLLDWNGGDIENGDVISLRDDGGAYVVAEGGGGGLLALQTEFQEWERLFTIVKLVPDPGEVVEEGQQEAEASRSDQLIRSGDMVALVASTGRFVAAEDGGGRELRADRKSISGWETFTLVIEDPGQ